MRGLRVNTRDMPHSVEPKEVRKMISLRLDSKTREALEKKAASLSTSQANAIGVLLGTMPESAFVASEKRGNLVTR
jgi:hypothetical protein